MSNLSRRTIKDPSEPSAFANYACIKCGHEIFVHAHYLLDGSSAAKSETFVGRFCASNPDEAPKEYLKLKKILLGSERFNASRLESQFVGRSLEWNLGEFLDFERERIESECNLQGITISFEKISR